jgi:hypothetical protein
MRTRSAVLSGPDEAILRWVGYFGYLTVVQILRLLYEESSIAYVQKRLKRLVEDELPYLIRDRVPDKRIGGSTPYYYTLSTRGAKLIESLGIDVPRRKRPSEQRTLSFEHIQHHLDTNDVHIAFLLAEKAGQLTVTSSETEWQLRAREMRITPDAFLDVAFNQFRYPFAIELDRGTEVQAVWRRKVRAIVAWYEQPYRSIFGTTSLTVLVVVAQGGELRLKNLLHWTQAELTANGRGDYAALFQMTCTPVAQREVFLFGDVWQIPGREQPLSIWDDAP